MSVMAKQPQIDGNEKLAASIRDLTKHYVLKSETVRALRGVSFDVPESDYIAIMGPSGSGKSTLLNLLGCLDRPTTGSFFLGDDDVATMNDDELSFIRASRIGFVVCFSSLQFDRSVERRREYRSATILYGPLR